MTEASDVHHEASLRDAWELIDTMERLGPRQSDVVFAPRWEASRRKGEDFFAPYATDEFFGQPGFDGYRTSTNLTRFARTMDFVRPGDRITEIGCGYGFLALLTLEAGQAASYRGIELMPDNVVATNKALASKGYADRGTAEEGNLYELTKETVAERGTDLLICCEVLEHVPDPEAALEVLASSLPDGADLLVSVPLRGRLEGIWGHVAQFGVPRVREMARAAGLVVHHVEPLANTWVLMLASREEHSDRATRAVAADPDVTADLTVPDEWSLRVDNEAPRLVESGWNKKLNRHEVTTEGQAVRLEAEALAEQESKRSSYAGLALACENVRGIRLELDLTDIDQVEAFFADFYAGSERVGRWKWVPEDGRPKQARPTFMLQPLSKGTFFRRQKAEDLRKADRFELFAQLPPGASVSVAVTRLGWFR